MTWIKTLRATVKKARKEYRDLALKHGSSRKKAVEWLTDIGSYGDRSTCFAISFNVKLHSWPDADDLYSHPVRAEFENITRLATNDGERGRLYDYFCHTAKKSDHFSAVQEALWEGFNMDDGTFWGPRRDAEFGLRGRGGGHLVLESCMGIRLDQQPDDLGAQLLETDRDADGRHCGYVISDEKVMHLFLLCVQLEIDLEHKNVIEEYEHEYAWQAWNNLDEDILRALLASYRNREEAGKALWAECIQVHNIEEKEALATVLDAAGIIDAEDS